MLTKIGTVNELITTTTNNLALSMAEILSKMGSEQLMK